VDKQHAAVVADTVAPAGQPGLDADVALSERAAGVSAVAMHAQFRQCWEKPAHNRMRRAELSSGTSRKPVAPQAPPRQDRSLSAQVCRWGPSMPRKTKPAETLQQMTAAEAVVATLIGHGLDTVYALPGVQNDHLFDALFKFSNRLRTVHTRHEQGAAYMALGAALATGKPQAYAVVPGPGLLNSAAALLTAFSMNAPVLALIGQIPDADIGRGLGHLHEIRDQTGIIKRLVDHAARIRKPEQASRATAQALRAMRSGRPGPAVLECAMDVWGKSGPATLQPPLPVPA